jgi:guanosine-3',5'-bis(diphosphate) 3'-pyrophosphohydrolase
MESASLIIEKVRDFTNLAHGDQTRRYSDDPYIVHPMRVMTTCTNYTDDLPILCAAILHDVLEDTPVSAGELEVFLKTIMDREDAERTLALVVELTDVFTKSDYPRMNRRTRRGKEADRLSKVSPEAQTIKYADILDNTDVTTNDPDFAWTFLRECQQILDKMKDGNPDLRAKAIKRVNDCLEFLGSGQSV